MSPKFKTYLFLKNLLVSYKGENNIPYNCNKISSKDLKLLWDKSEVEKLERYPQLPICKNSRKPLLQNESQNEQFSKQNKMENYLANELLLKLI